MPARHRAPGGTTGPVLFIAILVVLAGGIARLLVPPEEDPPSMRADDFVAALWPEQWRHGLQAAQARADDGAAGWRLHPEETTLAFARDVMQWPRIARLERCDRQVAEICGGPGTHYAVWRTVNSPPLIVSLDRLARSGEGGVWSVISVQGPRVFVDIAPGDTITVGERPVATTTLPKKIDGYLRTGSSFTVVPSGCGSGGGRVAKVEDGRIEMRLSLDAVSCYENEGFAGSTLHTGDPLRSPAVGFVFVALDHEVDSIGYAMDASMPPEIRDTFVGSEPILELAAVPVRFSPA